MDLDTLKFDDRGLIPAIVQDAETGKVLTLAYKFQGIQHLAGAGTDLLLVPVQTGAVAQRGDQRKLPAYRGAAGGL